MARSPISVEVTGLSKAVRALKAVGAGVDDLKDAFARIAAEAAGIVRTNVPHKTGRLASTVRGNRAQSRATVTIGRATVPYAGPINYGWPARNIAASNFIARSDPTIQPLAVQRLEAEIKGLVRKQGLS